MIIADVIGIVIGIVLGKKIPAVAVKWFAAAIFVLFGFIGLYQYIPPVTLKWPIIGISSALTVCFMVYIGRKKPCPVESE
ncbi:MAG: TMEM165/GDT1 family protein [Syntrophaceae bacterium]|nr:TMEM165/GDT1 family protein [Syntrophaceae bacterium]